MFFYHIYKKKDTQAHKDIHTAVDCLIILLGPHLWNRLAINFDLNDLSRKTHITSYLETLTLMWK